MIMTDLLSLSTTPTSTSYQPESIPPGSVISVCIVTEGAVEEVEYFKYIKGEYAGHGITNMTINIVNESFTPAEINNSNPVRRLDAMIDWCNNNVPIAGIENLVQDESWLVCDRDNGSFSSAQHDDVVRRQSTDNFKLILSNPALQIWLLFHHVGNIDALNLNSMARSKDRIRAVEAELVKYVPAYKHGSLDMDDFKDKISAAVANSKNYPADLTSLKEQSGTNFPDIIAKVMPWI